MWRSSSTPRHPSKVEASTSKRPPLSPRSTLTEVLRINQFRSKNGLATASDTIKSEDAAVSRNKDLAVLACIFTDIKYDCLRELIRRFDGDSRLELCTEQLYRYKDKWVQGRTQAPPRQEDTPPPIEEQFRTKQYQTACTRVLYREFSNLNRSAVDAVLAEVNHAYANARPLLQEIADKSWRATLQSLFRKRKNRDVLPAFLWEKSKNGREIWTTGSRELDNELEIIFVTPTRLEEASVQENVDHQLALQLNETEAKENNALYECQICYSEVAFESITTCSHEGHIACVDCVRRSLNEAIFGQNWAQSIDRELSTLRCLTPSNPLCVGHITLAHLHQAVHLERGGIELWTKFEDRLAEKALIESQMSIVRCPFCSYAEAESSYDLDAARDLDWRFQSPTHRYMMPVVVIHRLLFFLGLLLFLIFRPLLPSLPTLFYTAISNLAMQQRTALFRCLHPSCKRKSCLKCQKAWYDTHTCHEPLLLSLRQSVESARTDAVKRVCPRCRTAFVKSSGCNKLTCVCGYSMCYLCRKNIGKTGENEGGEGYRHFCEHFRPVPGVRCTQCDKCDLYKSEEEDMLVRKAGEEAEREWREREGKKGQQNKREVDDLKIDHQGMVGKTNAWDKFLSGAWSVQGVVDTIVAIVLVVKI